MQSPYDAFVMVMAIKKITDGLGTASTKATAYFATPANITSAISALNLGTASTHAHGDYATASQGAKADSAVQSIPDASTGTKGLVNKSAAITNASPGQFTINTGGSAGMTLAAITGSVYGDDSGVLKDSIKSLATALNATTTRLEELITKLQTAGVQT